MPPREITPFLAVGSTALISANIVAPSGVQLVGDLPAPAITWRQYRIFNAGNQVAFCAYGANAALAASGAVIPTNASVGAGSIPVAVNTTEIITAPVGQYWSATVTANTPNTVFITPGRGM